MKTYNDTDLREALRRREAKRPRTEVPADFLDNVLQDIECQKRPRRTWHMALTAIAAAASIALVMILSMQPEAMPEATVGHTTQYAGARDTLAKEMLTETVSQPTAPLGRATSPSRADSQSEAVGLKRSLLTASTTISPKWKPNWLVSATAATWHRWSAWCWQTKR